MPGTYSAFGQTVNRDAVSILKYMYALFRKIRDGVELSLLYLHSVGANPGPNGSPTPASGVIADNSAS
jgi:hypothetical protein